MYIISSCLLGKNCKYNGGNNYIKSIEYITENFEYIDTCPEELGGLSTPRDPVEIKNDRVIDIEGNDFTEKLNIGAKKVLEIVKKYNCEIAILKERSPSCGSNYIYDGSFSGRVIEGKGITTNMILKENIEVISEEELEKHIKKLKKRKI